MAPARGRAAPKARFFDYATRLGAAIDRAWSAVDRDEARLAPIAERILHRMPAAAAVDPAEVLRWFIGAVELPHQLDGNGTFGQPPITLWASSSLVIDLYYWLDGTTSVHRHGFSGAFQVVSGSSAHGTYRFDPAHRVSSRFQLGHLRPLGMELLHVGDTRAIVAGEGFIHSLFHLERPSTTLVVRTLQDVEHLPQLDYARPHVAFDPKTVTYQKWQQALGALRAIDPAAYRRELLAVAGRGSRQPIFAALGELSVSEGVGSPLFLELVDRARRSIGEHADWMAASLTEERRLMMLNGRRRHVRRADHRFFLAVLLNAPHRRAALDLVERQVGRRKPSDAIVQWVAEMARLPSPVDPREPNVLGVPFDEVGLELLRAAIDRVPLPKLMARLAADYDGVEEQRAGIEAFLQALRGSPLLRPLFVE